MPRTPLNTEPFDESFGPSKRCPRCRAEKALTPQLWTGRWVERLDEDLLGNVTVRRVRAPTVYCRECVNTIKRDTRLKASVIAHAPDEPTRAEWETYRVGPCAVCEVRAKHRATLARFGVIMVVCSQCKSLIEEAERSGDMLAYARERSSIMRRHVMDEVRIAAEVRARTNLTHVPAHKYNPEAQGATYSHVICLSLELSWRKIFLWLQREQVNAS